MEQKYYYEDLLKCERSIGPNKTTKKSTTSYYPMTDISVPKRVTSKSTTSSFTWLALVVLLSVLVAVAWLGDSSTGNGLVSAQRTGFSFSLPIPGFNVYRDNDSNDRDRNRNRRRNDDYDDDYDRGRSRNSDRDRDRYGDRDRLSRDRDSDRDRDRYNSRDSGDRNRNRDSDRDRDRDRDRQDSRSGGGSSKGSSPTILQIGMVQGQGASRDLANTLESISRSG